VNPPSPPGSITSGFPGTRLQARLRAPEKPVPLREDPPRGAFRPYRLIVN